MGRNEKLALVADVISDLGSLDATVANLRTNGKNLRESLKAYRKNRSSWEKEWFHDLKPIVKGILKKAKRASKAFDDLLDGYHMLERDRKYTSFSRKFREAMEVFEDLVAECNRYLKKYARLMKFHDWDKEDRNKVAKNGWPYLLSYENYTGAYVSGYKKLSRNMRTVAALRT